MPTEHLSDPPASPAARALVVEDNPKMAAAIADGLRQAGFVVDTAASGRAGEELAAAGSYSVILLDVMLPDLDGITVCRNLRGRGIGTKVLVLTALDATAEKVAGLDAGADDYLAKPFEFEELLARVRALVRRGTPGEVRHLRCDDLELDLFTRRAVRAGQIIELSSKEFSLLEFFMTHPDRSLSRDQICERVWDMNLESSSNVVDVYVSALRKKMDRGFARELIGTVKGIGYRFGVRDE